MQTIKKLRLTGVGSLSFMLGAIAAYAGCLTCGPHDYNQTEPGTNCVYLCKDVPTCDLPNTAITVCEVDRNNPVSVTCQKVSGGLFCDATKNWSGPPCYQSSVLLCPGNG